MKTASNSCRPIPHATVLTFTARRFDEHEAMISDEADDAAQGLRPRVDVALQEVREDGEREGGAGTREAERAVVGHDV